MPTLFAVVEAMLMPPIRRTQAAARASTTAVHLGPKQAVSELSARIQVMSAHGEFGQHSFESSARTSGNFGLRHNGHSNLGPNDCVASTTSLMCVFL